MSAVISEEGGVVKAELEGRLDTMNVNNMEMQFTAGIAPKAMPTIVDLTKVTFIASLGIRMLLTTCRTLDRRGAKMALYGATPPVMEVMETTALSEIIPVVGSEAEAVAAVKG